MAHVVREYLRAELTWNKRQTSLVLNGGKYTTQSSEPGREHVRWTGSHLLQLQSSKLFTNPQRKYFHSLLLQAVGRDEYIVLRNAVRYDNKNWFSSSCPTSAK